VTYIPETKVPHTLLPAGLLNLGSQTEPDESVVGLELLHRLGAVVHQGEASALAATILRPEAEHGHLVLGGLVKLAEFLAELVLGDVGAVGVQHVAVEGMLSSAGWANIQSPTWRNAAAELSHEGFCDCADGAATCRRVERTYTTICLRPRRGLRMNLRVRRVTCESAILAVVDWTACERSCQNCDPFEETTIRSRMYLEVFVRGPAID
jgi:hypothetical protein